MKVHTRHTPYQNDVGQGSLHLFPPNLGGSARILDKVHPISAVRHISQLT